MLVFDPLRFQVCYLENVRCVFQMMKCKAGDIISSPVESVMTSFESYDSLN